MRNDTASDQTCLLKVLWAPWAAKTGLIRYSIVLQSVAFKIHHLELD